MGEVAAAYAASLVAAGVLLASSREVAGRDRLRRRLGAGERGIRTPRARRMPADGFSARLAARALERGWARGHGSYAAALAGTGLLGAVVGFRLAGPVGALAGALVGALGFDGLLGRRAESQRERSARQLQELVRSLASGTRAGLSLRRALAEATHESEPPLREGLQTALRRLEVGRAIGDVLGAWAEEVGSGDARLLVAVLEIHRRTGGDLPSLLDEVAAMIGGRIDSRRHLRALTAQGRASGAVLAVLPVAFVGLLSGMGGNGLGDFYRTPLGAALLGAGFLLEALGFVWLRRIARGV